MTRIFLMLLCVAGVALGETFVSTDVPIPIPDWPGENAESHLTVPVNRRILDVNITVTITHTFDGDLRLYLVAPNNDVVRLSNRCGHSGDNYTNTRFDDEASVFICDGNAPFTGSYTPDQPLSAFDNLGSVGTWIFRVTDNFANDTGSIQAWSLTMVLGDTITAAGDRPPLFPSSFILSAYPNPFNPATTIAFSLPQPQAVKLVVYDVAGREVARLTDRTYPAGAHHMIFDGAGLPSGIYAVRLQTPQMTQTLKTVLLK